VCTISFVQNCVGLSRDESHENLRVPLRCRGLVDLADRRAIFPRDRKVAHGRCHEPEYASHWINWHRSSDSLLVQLQSRQVVKALAAKSSDEEIAAGLAALPLRGCGRSV